MTDLHFQPVPDEISTATKTLAWQARRGNFVFTIVVNAISKGYGISVSFEPDYLRKGPFETLEEAASACNQAAIVLEN